MRERQLKLLVLAGVVIAILFGWSGCGEKKSSRDLKNPDETFSEAESFDSTEKDCEGATEVTLAVISTSYLLDQAIEDFNGSQTECHVTVIKFEDALEKDHEAARMRLQAYLTANKDIDLILADDLDLGGLTEKGWIEDLTPYLEKSSAVSKEDYAPQILDAGKYEDIQAYLPREYFLHFWVVPREQYGKACWTMEEFLSYCREGEYKAGTRWGRMEQVLANDLDYFLDEEKGECYFDSPEFGELLSWLRELPEQSNEQGYSDSDYREAIANGEIAFLGKRLTSLRDVQFIEETFDGKANYVGYPGRDGKPVVRLEPCGSNLCMLARAANKKGAWRFLEWYATYRETQNAFLYSFPANDQLMQKLVEEELAQESENIDAETGNTTYRGRYPTQKEINVFYELLAHARKTPDVNQVLYPIVCQEIMAYFNGQKSLEEVTEIIQRRCTIYLQENL